METRASIFATLFERVEEFGITTYELSKLKALDTTTTVATSLVSRMSAVLFIAMFALILSLGVAFFLGDLLGKSYYGFFIVAGFYLVAGIAMYFFMHKWIKKPLSNLIISQALK